MIRKFTARLTRIVLLWEHPLWSALFALLIYLLLAELRQVVRGGSVFDQSLAPYYTYLADAFLHGQLHLRALPEATYDLVFFQGKTYLYWPPMPAILMMPVVAIFGRDFSDILFTIVLGGVNVGLLAWLLRSASLTGVARLTRIQRALLVLTFALGTVFYTLAPRGRVWFTGQLVAFFFMLWVYLAAIRLRGGAAFFFTGLALSGALLTRSHLALAGIWPAYWLVRNARLTGGGRSALPVRRLLVYCGIGLLPVVMGVAGMAAYNAARFGSLFDFGLNYHQMATPFEEDFARYGAFHLHYLPTNFFYQYIAYPLPVRDETFMGGSLFLLTPVFFGAFWGLVRGRPRSSVFFLLLTILMIDLPILLLMGTGWIQFGPRYTLDFTIPLLLLTSMGIRRWPLWVLSLLAGVSIVHYQIGLALLLLAGR